MIDEENNSFTLRSVALSRRNLGTDQNYIGLGLDVLCNYLELDPLAYYLDSQKLSDASEALALLPNSRNISIQRMGIQGAIAFEQESPLEKEVQEITYRVIGFPKDKSFEDFRKNAQAIYERRMTG